MRRDIAEQAIRDISDLLAQRGVLAGRANNNHTANLKREIRRQSIKPG